MEIPKISTKLEVLNKADNEEADIYMYGSISSYSWYDGISSNQVKEKLQSISAKTINVHINSPGGDVFESIAISNLLKNHDATIITHIDGLAASGASIIAMAADKVIMPKNTMMMIHKAWTYAAGNAEGLRKIANRLDKIDSAVTESYKSRFVGESEELEKLLGDETWLTAEECLALGFADELVEDIETEEKEDEQISAKEEILNKYKQKIVASANPEEKLSDQPKMANALFQFLSGLNTPKR
jgi:ATP-dependent Clp protease, protease subunit